MHRGQANMLQYIHGPVVARSVAVWQGWSRQMKKGGSRCSLRIWFRWHRELAIPSLPLLLPMSGR
jgi:hypothetical protein